MLGVDAATDAGFDIYSVVRNGKTVDLRAYAVLVVNGSRGLAQARLPMGAGPHDVLASHGATDRAVSPKLLMSPYVARSDLSIVTVAMLCRDSLPSLK